MPRSIIYRLKRQYGHALTIRRPLAATHNVQTGQIVRTFESFVVRRAVVLPRNLSRHFTYDLTYIAANNNFVGGGFYDINDRLVLVDLRDLPAGFVFNLDDEAEYDGRRYAIRTAEKDEQGLAWQLVLRGVESQETVDGG